MSYYTLEHLEEKCPILDDYFHFSELLRFLLDTQKNEEICVPDRLLNFVEGKTQSAYTKCATIDLKALTMGIEKEKKEEKKEEEEGKISDDSDSEYEICLFDK